MNSSSYIDVEPFIQRLDDLKLLLYSAIDNVCFYNWALSYFDSTGMLVHLPYTYNKISW